MNNIKNIIISVCIVIVFAIDVTFIISYVNLKKENTELKANGHLLPIVYEKFEGHGFGKVYELKKPSPTTNDSLIHNTFLISKDSCNILYYSKQDDGSVIKYTVLTSERPLTNSIVTELTPIIIDAIEYTEKQLKLES